MVFSDQEFFDMGKRVEAAEQEAETRKKDALRYKWELDQLQSSHNEKARLLTEREGRVSALTQVLVTKSEEINSLKMQNSELLSKLEKTQEMVNILQANSKVTEAQFHNEQEKYYELEKKMSELMIQSNPLTALAVQPPKGEGKEAKAGEMLKAAGAPETVLQQSAKCADDAVDSLRKLHQELLEDSDDKMRFRLTLSQVVQRTAAEFESLHFSIKSSTYLPAVHEAIFILVEDCPLVKALKLEHSAPHSLLHKFLEEVTKGTLVLKGTKPAKADAPSPTKDCEETAAEPMSPGAIDGFMDELLNDKKPAPKKSTLPSQTPQQRGPQIAPAPLARPQGVPQAPQQFNQYPTQQQQFGRGPPPGQVGPPQHAMATSMPRGIPQQMTQGGPMVTSQHTMVNPQMMGGSQQQQMIGPQHLTMNPQQQQMMNPPQHLTMNPQQQQQQMMNPQQQQMMNPQQQQMMNPQQQQMMNPQQQQMMNPQQQNMNPQQQMMNLQQQMVNPQQQNVNPQQLMMNPQQQMVNTQQQQMMNSQQRLQMVNPQMNSQQIMNQQMLNPQQIVNPQINPQQQVNPQQQMIPPQAQMYPQTIQQPQQSQSVYSTPQMQTTPVGAPQGYGAVPQGNMGYSPYQQAGTYR